MRLLNPKRDREEARKVSPALRALIVHAYLGKVQEYSEEMIQKKWEALQSHQGRDPELIEKLSQWLVYRRFNEIALKEIEEGTLDEWFGGLLESELK